MAAGADVNNDAATACGCVLHPNGRRKRCWSEDPTDTPLPGGMIALAWIQKDELQSNRSQNLFISLLLNCSSCWWAEKIEEEKARRKWQKNIRRRRAEKCEKYRGRKNGGSNNSQRRAEEGERMKCNLLDKKDRTRKRSGFGKKKHFGGEEMWGSRDTEGFQGHSLMRKS